jgi:hypothetical protein
MDRNLGTEVIYCTQASIRTDGSSGTFNYGTIYNISSFKATAWARLHTQHKIVWALIDVAV